MSASVGQGTPCPLRLGHRVGRNWGIRMITRARPVPNRIDVLQEQIRRGPGSCGLNVVFALIVKNVTVTIIRQQLKCRH
jgi:hypothetical protein